MNGSIDELHGACSKHNISSLSFSFCNDIFYESMKIQGTPLISAVVYLIVDPIPGNSSEVVHASAIVRSLSSKSEQPSANRHKLHSAGAKKLALDISVSGETLRYSFLQAGTNNDSTSKLELDVLSSGKKIALCALFSGKHVSLGLWHESVPLGDLGTRLIEECSEEEMQENLLPLFSRLCIYAFLGVNDEDIMHLKISKVEESLRSKISKARVYEAAFNILFHAACHSRLIRNNHQHKLKELTDEMLHEIGAEATESLKKSLASLRMHHGLNLSYCSRLSESIVSNSWRIHCYCPRSEMERKSFYGVADESIEYALNHQLLQYMFSLDSVVSMEDCIKVELKIDNLKCKCLQLDSYKAIPKKLEKEWDGRTITSNHERKNWRNDRRSTTTAATLEFTLRDNYGKDVVDFEPRNRNQDYKACQALAQGMESDRPFTQMEELDLSKMCTGHP
ncbi:hypothetical protein SUGI_0555240 [Cryptomeria japonica]|nr:hypothetical protein SUGI_0555240 [Cryptomeria japonica]